MTPMKTIRTMLFSDYLSVVFDFLILQNKHNIRTLFLNLNLICTLCEKLIKCRNFITMMIKNIMKFNQLV